MKLPKKLSKTIVALIIGLGVYIGAGSFFNHIQMNALFDKTTSSHFDINKETFETILDNTQEITLERKIFSPFKKYYYILIDDVVIGSVTGEFMPLFGDVLTMSDLNGNIIKKEYQVKKIGPTYGKLFNLSLDRLAVIKDSKGNKTSYIGEEKLNDLLKPQNWFHHVQYFYNSEFDKIGKAKPKFFILSKDYKIFDMQNNIDYIIDGNIFSLVSKAKITVNDDTEISKEDAIFYTIIENYIKESSKSSSSKKTSSTERK